MSKEFINEESKEFINEESKECLNDHSINDHSINKHSINDHSTNNHSINHSINKEFDIIVYGANSFTSKFVIQQLEKSQFKVGLSARNPNNIHISSFPKIQEKEILKIAQKCKILLNMTGPYSLIGSSVIDACIQSKTHYIDITGEVGFMKRIQKDYQEIAKQNKIKIIQGCGFDSVPADIGCFHLAKYFDECFIESTLYLSKVRINLGTWKTLLQSIYEYKMIKKYNKFDNDKFNNNDKSNDKLNKINDKFNNDMFNNDKINKFNNDMFNNNSYRIKFMGSDKFVVNSSAKALSHILNYSYSCYFSCSFFYLLIYFFLSSFIYFTIQYKFFYNLFLNHYRIFSFGFVQKNPENFNSKFEMRFSGRGFRNNQPISKELIIKGDDPGYKSTSIFVTQCAYTVLLEGNLIPDGVLTPAVAFHKSTLFESLKEYITINEIL